MLLHGLVKRRQVAIAEGLQDVKYPAVLRCPKRLHDVLQEQLAEIELFLGQQCAHTDLERKTCLVAFGNLLQRRVGKIVHGTAVEQVHFARCLVQLRVGFVKSRRNKRIDLVGRIELLAQWFQNGLCLCLFPDAHQLLRLQHLPQVVCILLLRKGLGLDESESILCRHLLRDDAQHQHPVDGLDLVLEVLQEAIEKRHEIISGVELGVSNVP
mmetsp:Transcript_62108/g.164949  ORF Transcript_62108/g.164949 Transcript_62108/m.164949 type:complete len:212 (+) Transcript_62108:478-1113(+)